jgi:hypothetical protein
MKKQGEQICRIFAYKLGDCFFCFGQRFENYGSGTNFGLFVHSNSHVLIFTKNWLGYALGDFFTNSSGHPCENEMEL